MNSINTVFISYSRYDAVFVDRLSGDLRQQGVHVWIDREQIMPGQQWQREIERGLNNANILIFVISRHSLRSQWVLTERDVYAANNRKIIPILIEDIDLSELPTFIANIQWADFRQSYKDGLESVFNGLGLYPQTTTTTTTPAPKQPNKIKGYAFLSYAEDDMDFVASLKLFLKEHGYAYWDYEESDRDYHSQFFLELESVIIEASATLSVLSESWKRSPWALKEFFFSQEVDTPVFLLKAKVLGPTLAIAGMTYIDFNKDKNLGFQKLHKELIRKQL